MDTKIVFALLIILFLIGCTTEVIEVEPEDITVTEPVETTPSEPVAPETTNQTTETNATTATATGHIIKIEEWEFDPDDITIKVGETVTWVNEKPAGQRNSDAQLLRIRGVCIGFKSGDFAPGEEFSYTFEEAGECTYRDIYQGNYAGKIVIE